MIKIREFIVNVGTFHLKYDMTCEEISMEERGLGTLLWARLVRLVTLRLVLARLATDSFHRYHSLGRTPFNFLRTTSRM